MWKYACQEVPIWCRTKIHSFYDFAEEHIEFDALVML